jgi:hypothetical protein
MHMAMLMDTRVGIMAINTSTTNGNMVMVTAKGIIIEPGRI